MLQISFQVFVLEKDLFARPKLNLLTIGVHSPCISILVIAIFGHFLVRLLNQCCFYQHHGISMPVFIILQGAVFPESRVWMEKCYSRELGEEEGVEGE